jgi:hypothetical protein
MNDDALAAIERFDKGVTLAALKRDSLPSVKVRILDVAARSAHRRAHRSLWGPGFGEARLISRTLRITQRC